MTGLARVLIVEDEWLIAEDHAATLRDAGFEIVGPAPSVEAALGLIDRSTVDVALLDIGLSGRDSYTLADRLRKEHVPFVFASGYGARELPARHSRARILAKPVLRDVLLEAVASLVAERRREPRCFDAPCVAVVREASDVLAAGLSRL